jgi:quercetin dioxygenase-like cupin family protein
LRTSTFTGVVYADPVLGETDGAAVTRVFFGPGGRTYWHSHSAGQLLLAVAGKGLICVRGGEAEVIAEGDVVWSPPGEVHWHGGGPATTLMHLAVSLGTATWLVTRREGRA